MKENSDSVVIFFLFYDYLVVNLYFLIENILFF